jgi:hypothetical protein
MKAIIRAKKPMDVRMYRMSAILRFGCENCRGHVFTPEKCGEDVAAPTNFQEREPIGIGH